MDLPRHAKLVDLWEIALRLTKGRYIDYELQHRSARVPASQDTTLGDVINANHEVFITPLGSAATSESKPNQATEELCLIMTYGHSSYSDPVVCYWEPKRTTKSLASVVFRYYRQKFTLRPSTTLDDPFIFWTKLRDNGDNHLQGQNVEAHWSPLSGCFTRIYSTGTLSHESCIDKAEESDDSEDEEWTGTKPLVFKVQLDGPSSPGINRDNTLSRLDILKQMFDAYINRLLAYNFQTHIGLVTFNTKASVSQKITHAVKNFRHKLNDMTAAGDNSIWDSKYCIYLENL